MLKEILEEAGLLRATEEKEIEIQNKKTLNLDFKTVEKCNKVYKCDTLNGCLISFACAINHQPSTP